MLIGSPHEEKIDRENNTVIDNHWCPLGTKEDCMRKLSKYKSIVFVWLPDGGVCVCVCLWGSGIMIHNL